MGWKKILGWVVKAPLILLVVTTAGVGFYAASGAIEGFKISYASPIFLMALIGLYGLGAFLHSRSNVSNTVQVEKEYLSPSNSNQDEETDLALEQYEIDSK